MVSRKILAAAATLCVSLLAFAQEAPKQEPSKSPYLGEVTAGKLNIRVKPSNANDSKIVGMLQQGAKVGVVGEQGDFASILGSKDAKVWVSSQGVKNEAGNGEVTADQVTVLSDARANADKLGSLPKGSKVKVLREHVGGYLQIEAPSTVHLWISKKYVKLLQPAKDENELIGMLGGEIPVRPAGDEGKTPPQVESKGEDAAVMDRIKEAERLVQLEKDKDPKDADYRPAIGVLESARAMARESQTRDAIEAKLKDYRQVQDIVERLKKGLAQIENPGVSGDFAFTGWVDLNGPYSGQPGTHKLRYGEKIVCYLRVRDGDEPMLKMLNQQYDNLVGVKGEVSECAHPWDPYKIVTVTEIVPLQPQAQ